MSVNDIATIAPTEGSKDVAVPATPVQLSATSIRCSAVVITARPGNTGSIAYGQTNAVRATVGAEVGALLAPGTSVTYPIWDVQEIWIDAAIAGNGVSFTTVVK